MMLQLTAHRTLALQAVLAQRVDVALVSLAHGLLLQSFFDDDGGQSCSALNITMDDKPPTAFAADLRQAKAWTTLEAQREAIRQRLPRAAGELFGWLLTQSQAEVLSLLAFCAATTVSTLQRHDGMSPGDAWRARSGSI